jgi:hypothetical protein
VGSSAQRLGEAGEPQEGGRRSGQDDDHGERRTAPDRHCADGDSCHARVDLQRLAIGEGQRRNEGSDQGDGDEPRQALGKYWQLPLPSTSGAAARIA